MSNAPETPDSGTDPSMALDATMSASSSAITAGGHVTRGTSIGRYVVLSKLGTGGMGVVLAAYDPDLDRKIALKLLKGPGHSSARARLQREAQALAKLDHRNVVSVYDVGVHEGQLFVAMEFVAGKTVGAWMNEVEQPRPWRDVLRVFADAGRGLAAAHEAGLVHRDFKPDNVMLGDDGRVRVMDFGLARAHGDEDGDVDMRSTLEEGEQPLERSLTQTGSVVGTPAYMSPEQFEGAVADVRSDQFGFCVSLYQALYGERPFAGKTLAALERTVTLGKIEPAPKGVVVPTWLRTIVVRGLAPIPNDRWPTMRALLEALADDPAARRRKWVAVAGVVGLIGGAAAGLAWGVREDAQTCTGFEARLVGVWDDDRRAIVQAAIEGTKLNYASETWQRVERGLDEYTDAWIAAREQACEATHNGEQSDELLDLRMACLDERLQHVRATVEVLAAADETVVKDAVDAVMGLPRLDRCADVDALMASIPPPDDPEVAQRVAALEQQLVKAEALENAGKYTEALVLADAVVDDAVPLKYEPLLTRAWLRQASLQGRTAGYQLAETTLEQAYESAVGQQMVSEAAEASTLLMLVVGHDLALPEQGRRWAKDAKPLVRVVGTDEAQAKYLSALGTIAADEGKFDEARGYHEQALALREKVFGLEHPEVAASLKHLGVLARKEGKLDEARSRQERGLAITETVLGPYHPEVAVYLANLGVVAQYQGNLDEARRRLQQALAIRQKALGPDHPDVGATFTNLGIVAGSEGKTEEARAHFERALAIVEKALGPNHPNVARIAMNLGEIARMQERYADARGYFERALAIWEQTLGPDHPDLGGVYINLGAVAEAEKKYEEAGRHYERALAILEPAWGPDHPQVAAALHNLGGLAMQANEYEKARAYYERALAIEEKSLGADPTQLAAIAFPLARALWDAPANAGRDRERARALAEQARSAYADAGEASAEELQEVLTWQANHRE